MSGETVRLGYGSFHYGDFEGAKVPVARVGGRTYHFLWEKEPEGVALLHPVVMRFDEAWGSFVMVAYSSHKVFVGVNLDINDPEASALLKKQIWEAFLRWRRLV